MRAPFQDGDFPGPVKYGYLNVGVVEAGPPALLGRTVFCLYPHQTAYVVPATDVTVVPEGRARGPGGARRDRRDRRQRAVGRRAPGRRPGQPWSARGWSAAAWRGCCPRSPASRSRWSTSTRPGPRSPTALDVAFAHPSRGHGRTRPGRARQRAPRPGCNARSSCWHRTARWSTSAGTATPRSGWTSAARSTPAGCRSAPARSARWPVPAAPAVPWRAARAGPRPAARPGLRRAVHRRVGLRGAAGGDGRPEQPADGPPCATRSPIPTRPGA